MRAKRRQFTPRTKDTGMGQPDYPLRNPTLYVLEHINKEFGYELVDERMVTTNSNLILKLVYPLAEPYVFRASLHPEGWSVRDVVRFIQRSYARIYRSRESEKRYGVWGHDIGDLMIERLYVTVDSRGTVTVTPAIGA